MNIRKATDQDEDQVYRLAKALATSFELDRQAFSKYFQEALSSDLYDIWVAQEPGQTAVDSEKSGQTAEDSKPTPEMPGHLIGYVLGIHHVAFYANGPVSWVEEIFVEEKQRRKGVGKKLMEAFEKNSLQNNSRLVGLATRRASDFYMALGYENSAVFFRKLIH